MLDWATATVSASPDKNLSPRKPFSSSAEVLLLRTETAGVADVLIKAQNIYFNINSL
jgi:hypothetical protein